MNKCCFIPRNDKQSDDSDIELDSTRKNPTSSVKRRRTTQVINITMSKVEEKSLLLNTVLCPL